MLFRVCLGMFAIVVALPIQAVSAQDLPVIRTSQRNVVPECVTPGRLMAFLRARNSDLDSRFEKIAVDYMRQGEKLGLRWDYAFFQMVVETGYLTFKGDKGRRSSVRPSQNNFAGLGATGRGVRGESFADVETGVVAHLQHVLMYTGAKIDNPVAERTRKVIEWRVLDDWRESIAGPMTFAQLAEKWAASDSYADAIETHASIFRDKFCSAADPAPELLAEARQGLEPAADATRVAQMPDATPAAENDKVTADPAPSGRALARRAIEDGKAAGDNTRSALGAGGLARLMGRETPSEAARAPSAAPAMGSLIIVNPSTPSAPPPAAPPQAAPQQPPIQQAMVQATSAVGGLLNSLVPQAPAGKCRVWTASYGGTRSMLIKAPTTEGVSYTVLDVNEGAEKREAEAYIRAYAKGGAVEGEFASQVQALEKAFQLCPEG